MYILVDIDTLTDAMANLEQELRVESDTRLNELQNDSDKRFNELLHQYNELLNLTDDMFDELVNLNSIPVRTYNSK